MIIALPFPSWIYFPGYVSLPKISVFYTMDRNKPKCFFLHKKEIDMFYNRVIHAIDLNIKFFMKKLVSSRATYYINK